MQTMTTTELVRQIGRVSLDVQRQPVKVTLRGEPVAVLQSFEAFEKQNCLCPVDRGQICPVHGDSAA